MGTADTPVEELGALLDELGVNHMELRVPGFVYEYARSRYGNGRLNITSRPDVPDDEQGMPMEEVPYAKKI